MGAGGEQTADVVVVLSSILVYIITLASPKGDRVDVYITVARVIRFMRLVKIVKRMRRMLIANKSRYQKDGFDLSLTYVTPSCIAMSFPASGADATFLNPIDDVIRFFMTKHPKHYLLFNLCAERSYDPALFDGMVEHIEIDDRNPPTIDQTVSFLVSFSAAVVHATHKRRTRIAGLVLTRGCRAARSEPTFSCRRIRAT